MIDFYSNLLRKLIILIQVAIQACRSQYEYNNFNSYQPAYNPMHHAHNSHGNYYQNSFVHGSGNGFALRSNLARDVQPNDGNVLVVPYPVPVVIFPLDNAKDSKSSKKVVTVNSIKTTEKPLRSIVTTETEFTVVTKIRDTTIERQQTAAPVTNTQPPTATAPPQMSEQPVFEELTPEPSSDPIKITETESIIPESTTTETVALTEETTVELVTESPMGSITTESYTDPNLEQPNDIIDIAEDEKLIDPDDIKNKTFGSSELSDTTTDVTDFEHGLLKYKLKPTIPYEPYDLIDLLDDDSLPALSYNYLNDYPRSTPCAKKTTLQKDMIDLRRIISDLRRKRKTLPISDLKSNKKPVKISRANLKQRLMPSSDLRGKEVFMPISDLRAKRIPQKFSNLMKAKGRPISTVSNSRAKRKPVLVSDLRAQKQPIQNKFGMQNFKIPRYGLVYIPDNVREKIRSDYIRTS